MTNAELLNELHRWFVDTQNLPGLPERLQKRIAAMEYWIDEYLERESRNFPTEMTDALMVTAMNTWFSLVLLRPERFTAEELDSAEQIIVMHKMAQDRAAMAIDPPGQDGDDDTAPDFDPELN